MKIFVLSIFLRLIYNDLITLNNNVNKANIELNSIKNSL